MTGVRRYNRIAAELTTNLDWLESGGWKEIGSLTQELSQEQRSVERKAARTIDDRFKGFGPKQARNFLQMLGLTRMTSYAASCVHSTRALNMIRG